MLALTYGLGTASQGRALDYISEKPQHKHKKVKTAADRTQEDMFAFLNTNMNAPGAPANHLSALP